MTFCISLVIALSLTSAGFNAQLIVRLQVQTAVRCRVDEFRSRKLCSIPHSCFLYRTGTILTVGIRTAIVRNTVFILISKPAFLTGAVLRFHQDSLIRKIIMTIQLLQVYKRAVVENFLTASILIIKAVCRFLVSY